MIIIAIKYNATLKLANAFYFEKSFTLTYQYNNIKKESSIKITSSQVWN